MNRFLRIVPNIMMAVSAFYLVTVAVTLIVVFVLRSL